MANNFIITINEIIDLFQSFADGHKQLNDFGVGPASDIGTSRQMEFPYMWTIPNDGTITTSNNSQTPVHSFTFRIVDRINQQNNYKNINGIDSDNQQETLSDTFQIAQDLILFIKTELRIVGIVIDNEDGITVEKIFDETTDKVTGHAVTIDLKTRHINCAIPYDGISVTATTYCPKVTVKNSDSTYSNKVSAGSILSLPDITVTTGDGDLTYPSVVDINLSSYTSSDVVNVYYNRPPIQNITSYDTYDEGWMYATNYDPESDLPSGAVLQVQDVSVSPDYLRYNNAFGHKFRLTGPNGGYYDFNDGQYKDVNGTVSDFETEFATAGETIPGDGYIIDHLTGLGWRAIRGGAANFVQQFSVVGTLANGYTDYYNPTYGWLYTLVRVDLTDYLNPTHRPPFQWSQTNAWCNTPYFPTPTTAGFVFYSNTKRILQYTKATAGGNRVYCRIHYGRDEFVTQ
jgi:hypothetical protein